MFLAWKVIWLNVFTKLRDTVTVGTNEPIAVPVGSISPGSSSPGNPIASTRHNSPWGGCSRLTFTAFAPTGFVFCFLRFWPAPPSFPFPSFAILVLCSFSIWIKRALVPFMRSLFNLAVWSACKRPSCSRVNINLMHLAMRLEGQSCTWWPTPLQFTQDLGLMGNIDCCPELPAVDAALAPLAPKEVTGGGASIICTSARRVLF